MRRKHKKRERRQKRTGASRVRARFSAILLLVFLFIWSWLGVWFVHHPPKWIFEKCESWPSFITSSLLFVGNPIGDFTDALGLTGVDTVFEYDEVSPNGSITFAGLPRRVASPAPDDIQILKRGEFIIGWSPKLRHPSWVAYHVPKEAPFKAGERPAFMRDNDANASPKAGDYKQSGYDRGHMAPNYAIATRFGAEMQRETFKMSNIAPQSPQLNRGVWRDIERRIADLWTARWGEIWVIVGAISSSKNENFGDNLREKNINIPDKFYQLIVAQEGLDVRAMALVFPQNVPWKAWPTRALVTIDELEEMTGFDFLSELPDFIQTPLESARPSRLWPINLKDAFEQISIRFASDK